MRTGASFVPIKHDGVIYIRPPLELDVGLASSDGSTRAVSSARKRSGSPPTCASTSSRPCQ